MNKIYKFTSAILSAGLLVTPISGLVNNYDNVAKAEYKNTQNNKEIKEIIYIKNSDILNILEEQYKNNQITKKDYQIIKSELQVRWGPQGETKVVVFWDGAFDLYLNSYMSYAIASASIAGAAALITGLLAAAGISGGSSTIPVAAIATFIGMVAGTELSRGVVVYFKKIVEYPSGPGSLILNYYPSQIRQQ